MDKISKIFRIALVIVLISSIHGSAQNLLSGPESVVYDSLYDRYLASNYNTGHIVAIDSDGNHSYFVLNGYCRNGLHIAGNRVYAACIDRGVKGFDLTSRELVMHVNIDGMINLNDIASDTSGNLYISDVYASKIFKIRLDDESYTTFVDCADTPPNGLYFNEINNSLLVAAYCVFAPIQQISLADSSVTTLVNTGYSYLDGITKDNTGNLFFSTWQTHSVYRYDSTLANPPQLVYWNSNGPADIFYNKCQDVLAIPVMWLNAIIFRDYSTSVNEISARNLPSDIRLFQNYPNPFNPSTSICYELPMASFVTIEILDLLGKKVLTLVDELQPAGYHETIWNAGDRPSGIYFFTIQSGESRDTKKMLLLK